MHCTIYTLHEDANLHIPNVTVIIQKQALMIRHIINNIMQPSSGFAFLLKIPHPGETTL